MNSTSSPDNRPTTAIRIGWAMHVLSVAILLGVLAWGAYLYPALPDEIPIHWNAAGIADDFRPKSVGWAFGPLFIALALVAGLIAMNIAMTRNAATVPSEREAYSLTLGYVNLSMAVIFGFISVMGWYDLDLGPWLIAAGLLGGLPVLLIMGFYFNRIAAERKHLTSDTEPTLNPQHWVMGGLFYSNPADPRTIVPKPPHTGLGTTFNLASAGGKLMMIVLVLIIVGTLLMVILL